MVDISVNPDALANLGRGISDSTRVITFHREEMVMAFLTPSCPLNDSTAIARG